MAEIVLSNCHVSINSVDLSDHVREVRVTTSVELQDSTAMGDGTHERLAGLKDWTAEITFLQDYAAGEVDATLWAAVGASIPVEFRPVNAARSATNPGYSGNGLIASYTPLGGSVGEALLAPVSIQANGALSRLTS